MSCHRIQVATNPSTILSIRSTKCKNNTHAVNRRCRRCQKYRAMRRVATGSTGQWSMKMTLKARVRRAMFKRMAVVRTRSNANLKRSRTSIRHKYWNNHWATNHCHGGISGSKAIILRITRCSSDRRIMTWSCLKMNWLRRTVRNWTKLSPKRYWLTWTIRTQCNRH